MNNEVVISMRQDFSISEFNEMMNTAKPVYFISNRKFFYDIRVLEKINILLVHSIVFLCGIIDNKENDIKINERISLDEALEIVELKLHKKVDRIIKRRDDESICEIENRYIFLLK